MRPPIAKAPTPASRSNRLLAYLPPDILRRFQTHLQRVPLEAKHVLYEARAPIDYVYFPIHGTLSAVNVMEDGSVIEVATVGREGAVGMGVIVGADTSLNRIFVQLSGEALRVKASSLKQAVEREELLGRLLRLYLSAFFNQVSQSVACNGLHPVLKRCCRWLLMTHDGAIGDEMKMTHEFLAVMLGVRRPGVTEVVQLLAKRGLIHHHRGVITIVDRKGLEAASCECYRSVKDEYERLLDGFPSKVPSAL